MVAGVSDRSETQPGELLLAVDRCLSKSILPSVLASATLVTNQDCQPDSQRVEKPVAKSCRWMTPRCLQLEFEPVSFPLDLRRASGPTLVESFPAVLAAAAEVAVAAARRRLAALGRKSFRLRQCRLCNGVYRHRCQDLASFSSLPGMRSRHQHPFGWQGLAESWFAVDHWNLACRLQGTHRDHRGQKQSTFDHRWDRHKLPIRRGPACL